MAEDLSGCLAALAYIALRRTPEQQEAVELRRSGSSNQQIASRLGVSPSAISQRLRGAGAGEEDALRRVTASIAVE